MKQKYSQAEMEAAFTAVQNKRDWKAPIHAFVQPQDIEVTIAAIEHFTATIPTVKGNEGPSGVIFYEVASIGYRKGPAGDH